jgi:hypothetical protein
MSSAGGPHAAIRLGRTCTIRVQARTVRTDTHPGRRRCSETARLLLSATCDGGRCCGQCLGIAGSALENTAVHSSSGVEPVEIEPRFREALSFALYGFAVALGDTHSGSKAEGICTVVGIIDVSHSI